MKKFTWGVMSLVGLVAVFLLSSVAIFSSSSLAQSDKLFNLREELSENKIIQMFEKIISKDKKDFQYLSFNNSANGKYIEPSIYDEIAKNGNATVIVYLSNDGINYSSYDLMEIQIRERQEEVLRALNFVVVKKTDKKIVKDVEDSLSVELLADNLLIIDGDINGEEVVSDNIIEGDVVDVEEEVIEVKNFDLIYKYSVVNGFAGVINEDGMKILQENNLVGEVYLDRVLSLDLQQSAPLIKAPEIWKTHTQKNGVTGPTVTGVNKTVCVIDSGIDYRHNALGGCFGNNCKVRGGYNFVNNTNNVLDDNGHGTHVAGIVAANSSTLKGVAPDARLVAVKSCDSTGSCSGAAMIAGVDYCTNQHLTNYDVDVITMSIGDSGRYTNTNCPTWMEGALGTASLFGIPITASSGNDGFKNGISYPSCSLLTISVGATYDANVGSKSYSGTCTDSTTSADKVTCFSNSASNLDVMAPGAVITSTASSIGSSCGAPKSQGVGNCSGTSMAAPHVAGTIALMKQSLPYINPSQIKDYLKTTGFSVSDVGNNLNFSRIDVQNAINKMIAPRWGEEIRLTYNDSINPFLIKADNKGNIYVVWGDYRNKINYEIYYKKLDNKGNVLINDTRLTFSPLIGPPNSIVNSEPKLVVDNEGNLHFSWDYWMVSTSNYLVYYKKLDGNGIILVNDTIVSRPKSQYTSYQGSSSLDVDSQGNVHIAWSARGSLPYSPWWWEAVYYRKLDNNGSTLVDYMPLVFSDNGFPSLAVDGEGNVHVTWGGYLATQVGKGNNVYYKKLDNNGSTLVNNTLISFNNTEMKRYPSLVLDNQGNVHVAWYSGRESVTDYNFSIDYSKLENNGRIIINSTRLTFGANSLYPSLAVDIKGNVHIVFSRNDTGSHEINYLSLDNNGNVLVNNRRLTYNNRLEYSINPHLEIDSDGNLHTVFLTTNINNIIGKINYKRSYFPVDMEISGTPSGGNSLNFEIKDEMSPNQLYVSLLSLGYAQGMNLPDGRNIPLNYDFLLSSSLGSPSGLGIRNSIGYLDNNGRANVTWNVPNINLSGLDVYAGFVSINSTSLEFNGISNAKKISFV